VWDSKAYLSSAPIPTKTTWDLTGDITISPIREGSRHVGRRTATSMSVLPLPPKTGLLGGKLHSTLRA